LEGKVSETERANRPSRFGFFSITHYRLNFIRGKLINPLLNPDSIIWGSTIEPRCSRCGQ